MSRVRRAAVLTLLSTLAISGLATPAARAAPSYKPLRSIPAQPYYGPNLVRDPGAEDSRAAADGRPYGWSGSGRRTQYDGQDRTGVDAGYVTPELGDHTSPGPGDWLFAGRTTDGVASEGDDLTQTIPVTGVGITDTSRVLFSAYLGAVAGSADYAQLQYTWLGVDKHPVAGTVVVGRVTGTDLGSSGTGLYPVSAVAVGVPPHAAFVRLHLVLAHAYDNQTRTEAFADDVSVRTQMLLPFHYPALAPLASPELVTKLFTNGGAGPRHYYKGGVEEPSRTSDGPQLGTWESGCASIDGGPPTPTVTQQRAVVQVPAGSDNSHFLLDSWLGRQGSAISRTLVSLRWYDASHTMLGGNASLLPVKGLGANQTLRFDFVYQVGVVPPGAKTGLLLITYHNSSPKHGDCAIAADPSVRILGSPSLGA